MSLSFYEDHIPAGFPSPAEGILEKKLDLNHYLIKHPAATFFVRVGGDSMIDAGIFPEDILIVDRALEARSGQIIVAIINGSFTVKRFVRDNQEIRLVAANVKYKPILIKEADELQIWGVVTYVIHKPL